MKGPMLFKLWVEIRLYDLLSANIRTLMHGPTDDIFLSISDFLTQSR